LWEVQFKDDVLINLMEEMSRQPSLQTVTWAMPAIFSHIYSEDWKQKAERKDLKKSQIVH
jgi:hypothetical protein